MRFLFLIIFTIFISGCGGGESDASMYPETEDKLSKSTSSKWDKGAWDNLKWK